ncbi:hypothetical protein G5714_002765 [Onychostoma macrolepis]|uniref:PiggyBac transposable element-derived protein 4 C-terminal zinc-ribbon domain-containing protein n=1 Tax=Onychostoma macrolepis TaxID=369639 RepID=A0A7J6D7L9_9TELE|nr:hypothetical protein G5714_002765 [Onychostoma macrolepis]
MLEKHPAPQSHLGEVMVGGLTSEPTEVEQKLAQKKPRRKCRLCGKCTPFMCEACQVPLCVILDRNCLKSYHS